MNECEIEPAIENVVLLERLRVEAIMIARPKALCMKTLPAALA